MRTEQEFQPDQHFANREHMFQTAMGFCLDHADEFNAWVLEREQALAEWRAFRMEYAIYKEAES